MRRFSLKSAGTALLLLAALSAGWTSSGDDAADLGYGRDVVGADLNGDGYMDLVVGSAGSGGSGKVHLYLGSPAGPSTIADWTLTGLGIIAGEYAGWALAAGDVDGDGYDDLIVGGPGYGEANADCSIFPACPLPECAGTAYLFLGSPSGLGTTPAWTSHGSGVAGERFGASLAMGDVNGDGYDDLAVGADNFLSVPSWCFGTGSAYVYLGGPGGLASAPAWTSSGDGVPRAEYGEAVSVGDLDGDGYAEVVVGAPMYYATSMTGKVFVYSGTPSGPELVPTWTAVGEGSFGIAVSAAGDLNDDGHDDLLISGALAPFTGGVHLYFGASSGLDTAPAWTAVSVSGRTIESGGDVNGDGYDDLVIGDWMYFDGTDQTGRAYLYLGGPLGPAATYAWTSAGDEQAYSSFGVAVGIAGDVNGDGYADVLVGASRYDTANDDAGKAYLYLGANAPTGVCDPAGVPCDDGDPCSTSSECDSAGVCVGVSFVPAGAACDDDDACTAGDACDGVGACIGGTDVCEADSGTMVDSGTPADSSPPQSDAGMNVKGGGCSCRLSGVSRQIPLTGCFIVLAGLVLTRSLRRRLMSK